MTRRPLEETGEWDLDTRRGTRDEVGDSSTRQMRVCTYVLTELSKSDFDTENHKQHLVTFHSKTTTRFKIHYLALQFSIPYFGKSRSSRAHIASFYAKHACPGSPTAYLPSPFPPLRVTLIGPGQHIRRIPITSLPPVEISPDWPRSTNPKPLHNFGFPR
jgi:hypothetical protein